MSLQHIQKNSPRLLPKPAKFEKNPPNGYRVIRKTKCRAGGAGGARSSPIHKQASPSRRSRRSQKLSHTQTSVPCGTLNHSQGHKKPLYKRQDCRLKANMSKSLKSSHLERFPPVKVPTQKVLTWKSSNPQS